MAALETLQSVPEANAPAEEDRNDDDVQMVDEPCGNEVTDDRRASTDADVLTRRSVASRLERFGGRCVDEMERRASLHLDRRGVPT